MIVASKLSNKIGTLNSDDLNKIIKHFNKVGLPIFDVNVKNKKIINIVTKDKKNISEKINLILIKKIGQAYYLRTQNINNISKLLD